MASNSKTFEKKLAEARAELVTATKQLKIAETTYRASARGRDEHIAKVNWKAAKDSHDFASLKIREVEREEAVYNREEETRKQEEENRKRFNDAANKRHKEAHKRLKEARKRLAQIETELNAAKDSGAKERATMKWKLALKDLEYAGDEEKNADRAKSDTVCPTTPQTLRNFLCTSPEIAAIKDIMDTLNPQIRNPWSPPACSTAAVREKGMRQRSAQHYDRYHSQANKAQCSVTNRWGDEKTVIGAHLLPVGSRTTAFSLNSLGMKGKLNDFRNVIPLLKTIEEAYDAQRLCFMLHDPKNKAEYRLQILDPTLKSDFVFGSVTFEEQSYRRFRLPVGRDSRGPFTRCLSFHAQVSLEKAVSKGWIVKSNDKCRYDYGSPLDKETIGFSLDSAPQAELNNI